MRSVGPVYDRLCTPEHLELAAARTVRGKRHRRDIAWFLFRQEEVLERLSGELAAETWEPQGYEVLRIRDPKPRVIARAPVEDRVVHSAIALAIEPVLLRSLRPEAMACRPGMGTHRAVLRLLELQRRHPWFVHLDVRSYFPSVQHELVLALLGRKVRDRRLSRLVGQILDTGEHIYGRPDVRRYLRLPDDWPPPGTGLPIGSVVSQVLAAHLVLAELDHRIKRQLRVPGYVRYVDDFVLFGPSRSFLLDVREEVARWLWAERRLRLKRPHARVRPSHGHLDALGFRIRRDGMEPLARTTRRFERRARARIERGGRVVGAERAARSVTASAGMVMFGSEVAEVGTK